MATAAEIYTAYSCEFGGRWSKTAFGKAIAERFEKQKPKSGPYRDKVVYSGIRVAAGSAQDRDFPEKSGNWDGLGPVSKMILKELADSKGVSWKPVPTSPTSPTGDLFEASVSRGSEVGADDDFFGEGGQ
jgi:hypothetical protein